MGNSSQGSSNESSNNGTIVNDEGTSSVKAKFCCNKSDNKKNCRKSNISLTQLNWNYKFIGCHRIIELEFHCSNCNSYYYVLMDKTSYGTKRALIVVIKRLIINIILFMNLRVPTLC